MTKWSATPIRHKSDWLCLPWADRNYIEYPLPSTPYSIESLQGEWLLFNHLSIRADDKSTIITTNLACDRWGEIIRDKVLVAAMVDRLTHNAHLINMNGQSYRLKETKAFNEQKQNEKWTFLELSLQKQDFCDIFATALVDHFSIRKWYIFQLEYTAIGNVLYLRCCSAP